MVWTEYEPANDREMFHIGIQFSSLIVSGYEYFLRSCVTAMWKHPDGEMDVERQVGASGRRSVVLPQICYCQLHNDVYTARRWHAEFYCFRSVKCLHVCTDR